MLLPAAEHLREQLTQRALLLRAKDDADDIAKTHAKLASLVPKIRGEAARFLLVADRFPPNERETQAGRLRNLAERLRAIRADFIQKPLQTQELTLFEGHMRTVDEAITKSWQRYAEGQTRQLLASFDSLRELLALQGDAGLSSAHVAQRIRVRVNDTPHTRAELDAFDADRETLRRQLESVEGVNPDVTQFLHKVTAGTATLADLDDATLQWCREQERAATFAIRFVPPGGGI